MSNAVQRVIFDVDAVAKAIEQADPLRMQHRQSKSEHLYDYRRMALAAIDTLGLTEEINENTPILVPEFADDGSPIMCDHTIGNPNIQKRHFEWVAKRRLVTPWVEVGERARLT